jgi:hypothetical protein
MKHSTSLLTFAVLDLLLMLASTGCSVDMAMSGKHPQDLGALHVGETRDEAENPHTSAPSAAPVY